MKITTLNSVWLNYTYKGSTRQPERIVKHIKQSSNKNERTLGVGLEIREPVWWIVSNTASLTVKQTEQQNVPQKKLQIKWCLTEANFEN